jgi:membrane associated rhomboid family serine protease
MLRYVASGPFPAATDMGAAGATLGLLVHFALMAIMAAVLMAYLRRNPDYLEHPIWMGVVYGLITYAVMNWVVVPLRFDAPLPPRPLSIATQLFAHIVLVGVPMALVARRYLPSSH